MKLIREAEYAEAQEKYGHLFDICTPKPEMLEKDLEWLVRDGFDPMGTLMVGDLRVKKHETTIVEIHPFPEWVVQMRLPQQKSGKVYALVPELSQKDLEKLARREWNKRIEKLQDMLDGLTPENYFAIEYQEGISIKIPANVPHEFLSVVASDEKTPYCQVFEPNFKAVGETLKIDTPYFNLKYTLKP